MTVFNFSNNRGPVLACCLTLQVSVWAFEKLADKKWGVIGEHINSHQAAGAPVTVDWQSSAVLTTSAQPG
jgi:hypothetical protein